MSQMQFSKRDAANEVGFVSDPTRITTDRLNILVVDDSPSILALLRSYLLAQGHAVASADDGEQALAMFDRITPDLVLMDVVMPGLDGIEVTRKLRESTGSRWVPIILLSALSTEQDVVRGLEAGADDYLSKPINLAVMQAKIRSFQRIVRMQGEILEQSGALQKLQEEQTYEQELAAALINNIVQRQGLNDALLSWHVLPSARFSGDVVAAERSASGMLYALLGDATGHGLAASVSLIPALQVFYGMARKGLPLGTVAREMNLRLREQLPVGRYLATIIVAIDERNRRLQYWNGGMPPAFLLAPDGSVIQELSSDQLALGILDDAEFEDACRDFTYNAGEALLLYSDGLIEAEDASGDQFGLERLRTSLQSGQGAGRVDRVMRDLHTHLGCIANHDDASILSVDLP